MAESILPGFIAVSCPSRPLHACASGPSTVCRGADASVVLCSGEDGRGFGATALAVLGLASSGGEATFSGRLPPPDAARLNDEVEVSRSARSGGTGGGENDDSTESSWLAVRDRSLSLDELRRRLCRLSRLSRLGMARVCWPERGERCTVTLHARKLRLEYVPIVK
jgi:hypothetical protein